MIKEIKTLFYDFETLHEIEDGILDAINESDLDQEFKETIIIKISYTDEVL